MAGGGNITHEDTERLVGELAKALGPVCDHIAAGAPVPPRELAQLLVATLIANPDPLVSLAVSCGRLDAWAELILGFEVHKPTRGDLVVIRVRHPPEQPLREQLSHWVAGTGAFILITGRDAEVGTYFTDEQLASLGLARLPREVDAHEPGDR